MDRISFVNVLKLYYFEISFIIFIKIFCIFFLIKSYFKKPCLLNGISVPYELFNTEIYL